MTTTAPLEKPNVTVTASADAWIQFVPDPALRRASELDIEIDGDTEAIRRFERLLRTFPHAAEQQRATEGVTG